MHTLFYGFRIRECPSSIKDFRPRLIHPDEVVPSRDDRQEVVRLGVTTEVDGNAPIFALLGRDVVERVSVVFVDRHPATGSLLFNGIGKPITIDDGRMLQTMLY